LTASGTVWCLLAIKHFIAHPYFFNEVIHENWSKKNLTLNGITSNQNIVSHSNPWFDCFVNIIESKNLSQFIRNQFFSHCIKKLKLFCCLFYN
jgi:DNA mismatch repair ATPase MutL